MKVTQRLIEKYHLNLCSSEEKKAVEEWLLNDDMDNEILLPSSQDKQEDKVQMWNAIAETLPTPAVNAKQIRLSDYFSTPFLRGIAAASIGIILFATFFLLNKKTKTNTSTVAIANAVNKDVIQTSELNITLGTKSNVNINTSTTSETNNIDFCGIIRIESKEDMEFTLNANCVNTSANGEKVSFKKGQTYIAVNYHYKKDNELIIVNEKNLLNLPPVLQKEIIRQFNI